MIFGGYKAVWLNTYLANFSDMKKRQFCDKIIEAQPIVAGDVMTVAKKWNKKVYSKACRTKKEIFTA